jgi:secreted PhoX family phosphatase
VRWGDPVMPGAPAFDPAAQSAAAQAQQFGYNCDFIGYMPLPFGSDNSSHGLLVVNHEYANPHVMFANLNAGEEKTATTAEQAAIEAASQGLSIVEIERVNGAWRVVEDSVYSRRITTDTAMHIAGPAAGHDLLKTSYDPSGTKAYGTQDNCSGGMTPWGTVLSCEEGSADWFGGDPTKVPGAAILARSAYDPDDLDYYGWARHMPRFNMDSEPNEPFRFEWVVEIDPYTPGSMPVKRTALGRFGHEAATTVINGDGRVVVYMGDDDYFEYAYKFVSNGTFNPTDREANFGLLDDGTLYVARFNEDGTVDWLPLVQGEGPLTAANGFATQADVLINPRGAGDVLGATPMDRPEDFEANPVTGRSIWC